MKTIYTSNYARKGDDPLAFGISCSVPKWYKGRRLQSVAPTWGLVSSYKDKQITQKQYAAQYYKMLEEREFKAEQFIASIPDGAYLLCYESPGDFCHRRLLAAWINAHSTSTVNEWRNEKEENLYQQRDFVDEMVRF